MFDSPLDRKHFRYVVVSVLSVVIGQSLLFLFFEIVGLAALLSNFLCVALSTVPNYILNRFWVWGKSGPHDLKREVLPYWIIAFMGLGLSSLFVFLANFFWSSWYVVNGANMTAYGVLWVLKFIILDRYLFNPNFSKKHLNIRR
tara:strand:+ start:715 stop:1146 length:432 start_codon:yes stop_codon:yes gene_type:complete